LAREQEIATEASLFAAMGQATACHVLPADYPTHDYCECGPVSMQRCGSKEDKEVVTHV